MTGGGILKSLEFAVKSSTRSVADIMITFNGDSGVFFSLRGTILDNRPNASLSLNNWTLNEESPTYEDIGEDGSLVSLVNDDDRIRSEEKVSLDLPQQDPVSHELDLGLVRHVPLVPANTTCHPFPLTEEPLT